MTTTTTIALSEAQKGPAEKLLDLVLGSFAHLWHNRPGLDVGGVWYAKRGAKKRRSWRGRRPCIPASTCRRRSGSTRASSTSTS